MVSGLKLSEAAVKRISDAGARAVRERPKGTSELHAVVAACVASATREVLSLISKELDTLKTRTPMVFRGAYMPDEHYQVGDVCQRSGAIHICMAGTYDAPGSSASWRKIGVCKDQ